jgi:hypothetical protein
VVVSNPSRLKEAHQTMTDHQATTTSIDDLDDICNDCREARYLNGLIARLIDLIHDHAAKIPHAHGLKDTLTMVSALRKELIQMKGGKPASEEKPWLKWEQEAPKLDRTNIAEAVKDSLDDLLWTVLTEEDDDEQCDMAVVMIQTITEQVLDFGNEYASRSWVAEIIKDTAIDQLGYWPDDDEDEPAAAPIAKNDNGQQS